MFDPALLDKLNSLAETLSIIPMGVSTYRFARDKTHLGQSLFSNWYWAWYPWWSAVYFVGLGQWWSLAFLVPQAVINSANVYFYYVHRNYYHATMTVVNDDA